MAEELEPWVVKTQQDLGSVIQTPKLTEKLLRKPPFRFLHDIVTNFLKTTGFPANLYSPEMLDSAKCTEKEQKLEFLNQLIEVVQAATGKSTVAKAAKIIAGAEPEGTNDLLQLLGACAKLSKGDQENAVKRVLGGGKGGDAKAAAAPAPAPAPVAAPEPAKKKEAPPPPPKTPEEAPRTPPQTEAPAPKQREPSKREKPQPAAAAEEPPKTTPPTSAAAGKGREVPQPAPVAAATSERPGTATARKPPPPTKGPQFEPEVRQEVPQPASGVIVEGKRGQSNNEDDENTEKDWMKVVEEHETAKSRPTGNTDTEEAKGYLGQQALKAKKEQEEAAKKAAEEARLAGFEGGLVINQSRTKDKSSAMGEGELSKLREQLQMLSKASNPLGKFLEAIHEDMDTMARELEMWRTEARTQAAAAREAQRQTEESLHDIYSQLQNLEDSINDQIIKTNIARAAILNNDKAIDTMVRMVVNPDSGKGGAPSGKK